MRVFIARGLHEVERPEAENEEADMDFAWVDLEEAADKALRGEVVNSIAVSGILAAARLVARGEKPRPVDEPFHLRPTSLANRRAEKGIVPDMKRV